MKRTLSLFAGVLAAIEVFLMMIACFSDGVVVGGADFASFDMVRGYLLLEGTGAVGAVGFYEHIAGVVFSFLGQRGITRQQLRACNSGAIARVSTVSFAGAAQLFVLCLLRDVVPVGLLVLVMSPVADAAECASLQLLGK